MITMYKALAAGLAALITVVWVGAAQAQSGRFLAISDVHLSPLTTAANDAQLARHPASDWDALWAGALPPPSDYGADANVPLLTAALTDAQGRLPRPDFVIYPGDFVMHRLDRHLPADQVATVATRTTLYLADQLRAAFPDTPILPALGNTDSACGDYEMSP